MRTLVLPCTVSRMSAKVHQGQARACQMRKREPVPGTVLNTAEVGEELEHFTAKLNKTDRLQQNIKCFFWILEPFSSANGLLLQLCTIAQPQHSNRQRLLVDCYILVLLQFCLHCVYTKLQSCTRTRVQYSSTNVEEYGI